MTWHPFKRNNNAGPDNSDKNGYTTEDPTVIIMSVQFQFVLQRNDDLWYTITEDNNSNNNNNVRKSNTDFIVTKNLFVCKPSLLLSLLLLMIEELTKSDKPLKMILVCLVSNLHIITLVPMMKTVPYSTILVGISWNWESFSNLWIFKYDNKQSTVLSLNYKITVTLTLLSYSVYLKQ